MRRLVLVAFVVAAKTLQDTPLTNRAFSKIGGVPVRTFAGLEKEFLGGVDFQLFVGEREYLEYKSSFFRFASSLTSSARVDLDEHTGLY